MFSPKRIILDKDLKIKLNSYIFKSVKKDNTIIFYNSLNHPKIKILKKKGVILVKSQLNNDRLLDLKMILKKLFSLGVRNLLVEGGDKFTRNLIKDKLIDSFYLFQSPKIMPKSKTSRIFSSSKILNKNYKKKYRLPSKLAKDNITIYKR